MSDQKVQPNVSVGGSASDALVDELYMAIDEVVREHEEKGGIHGAPLVTLARLRDRIDKHRQDNGKAPVKPA